MTNLTITQLFENYPALKISGFADYAGINPKMMQAYKRGDTYISNARKEEIEQALRALASELLEIHLV